MDSAAHGPALFIGWFLGCVCRWVGAFYDWHDRYWPLIDGSSLERSCWSYVKQVTTVGAGAAALLVWLLAVSTVHVERQVLPRTRRKIWRIPDSQTQWAGLAVEHCQRCTVVRGGGVHQEEGMRPLPCCGCSRSSSERGTAAPGAGPAMPPRRACIPGRGQGHTPMRPQRVHDVDPIVMLVPLWLQRDSGSRRLAGLVLERLLELHASTERGG